MKALLQKHPVLTGVLGPWPSYSNEDTSWPLPKIVPHTHTPAAPQCPSTAFSPPRPPSFFFPLCRLSCALHEEADVSSPPLPTLLGMKKTPNKYLLSDGKKPDRPSVRQEEGPCKHFKTVGLPSFRVQWSLRKGVVVSA